MPPQKERERGGERLREGEGEEREIEWEKKGGIGRRGWEKGK